jgi:hypothetical protein
MIWKVFKNYKGQKLMIIIVHQLGMSYSTVPMIMKNKNKVMEVVKGSVSLKAIRMF